MRALTLLGPALLPVLLASFPLLSLFQQNETDIELGVLWPPLGVCVAAALGIYLVLLLVFKNGLKAAAVASALVVCFFYYATFADRVGLRDRWFLPLWFVVFVLIAVLLARTGRNLGNVALALGIAAVVLVVGPLVKIAIYQVNHPLVSTSNPRLWHDRLAKPAQPKHRPDIYVLILDDYARLDVLRHYFHYSDAAFVGRLRKRGFAVSEQVRSPYSDSEMNVAAAVNMGYLDGLARILGRRSQDVRPVRRLIADSRSSQLLKSLGYRYVQLDSDEVTFPSGNPDVSEAVIPDSITNLWLQKTALRAVGATRSVSTRRRVTRVTAVRFARRSRGSRQSRPSPARSTSSSTRSCRTTRTSSGPTAMSPSPTHLTKRWARDRNELLPGPDGVRERQAARGGRRNPLSCEDAARDRHPGGRGLSGQ